jgi:hypothetical protein
LKKLLIIQLDEAYFLFETLITLDHNRELFNEFEITLLVDPKSLSQFKDGSAPILGGITTDLAAVVEKEFDLSVNLSMNETSWSIHEQIKSQKRIGPYEKDKQLFLADAWSAYLLTLKARAPFLTFHLQDIYKNILGIKKVASFQKTPKNYQYVVIGLSNTDIFSSLEQEKMVNLILSQQPHLKIRDISEIDPISNLSQVLYIGPANFQALKICEAGARGIFLTSHFQGFNLLPHDQGHLLISSKNSLFSAEKLLPIINGQVLNKEIPLNSTYAIYTTEDENIFGSYLKSLNSSDDNYPIYQSHVVLWNFILNLYDVHLDISRCHLTQLELIRNQIEVLNKLIRLYDYAMSSVDTIHQEAKSSSANNDKIQGHLKNLKEMDAITDQISQTNSFLRPILDFYRIRRGQNSGATLLEQSQHSFLTYSEEHQALKAMLELFSVTLSKNEVSI